jgi:3-oxoacyl-[acyl-carrier protein] reductase
MSQEEWQQVIDTNLTGAFNVSRIASELMRDNGRIVSLSSISAFVGFFGQANYAAAKGGIVAFTKVLSRELAKRQITVNAVAPGVILTDMSKSIPEDIRAAMLPNIPLGRFGRADDVAHTILFLCSDLASYITGQTVHVNGGWWG